MDIDSHVVYHHHAGKSAQIKCGFKNLCYANYVHLGLLRNIAVRKTQSAPATGTEETGKVIYIVATTTMTNPEVNL
jgi:hypothetical protein